jgi:hypothetical protein
METILKLPSRSLKSATVSANGESGETQERNRRESHEKEPFV